MGRDVTGVRADLNKSPYAKVRPKVSVDTDREIIHKVAEENKDVKDCEVKECTSEAPRAENTIEKQEASPTKSTDSDTEKLEMKSPKTKDQKSSSPEKKSSAAAPAESMKIKNTPQKPSDVTIDKQVCGSLREVKSPVFKNGSNSKSPTSPKQSKPSTPHVTRKNLDDEDSCSMTSSASFRTTRSKTTVPVAPTFTISDRLEKRREYYAKLEEKRKAMEAEKREYEARTKEEEEAAIRQMRKNMKFKANPVPSFYYEKTSPTKEVKKLPTTRAVSPTFGRRKSFNDAVRPLSEVNTSGRVLRHSVSGRLHKEGSTPTTTPKRMNRLTQVSETSKQTPPKMTKRTNPDIAVQS
ncbi:hypothetical protein RND81_09G215100 [Saponaria officinalis]|uniref:TPX2 C-terminal domain-containing protein n=1 Tax=Saponaria officinalis TaxID=3572 RepID=A0AAW1INX9_SAPOF